MNYPNHRAAAFTIAVLHYGLDVESVSTYEAPDIEGWVPWANVLEDFPGQPDDWFNPQCDPNNLQPDFIEIGILAAEIIAMRPEKGGRGPRWNAIDLESLEIAARLVRIPPERDEPLFAVGQSLCGDWWNEDSKPERRAHLTECAEIKFAKWWQEAMELVRHYRAQIDMLADMLVHRDGYIHGNELRTSLESTATA